MTLDSSAAGEVLGPSVRAGPTNRRVERRILAFDGFRGAACILVILVHAWTIVPVEDLENLGPLRGLFKSGNLGVTMFFVLGSFLVTRSLLEPGDNRSGIDVTTFWTRRMVRIGSQLYLLVVVLYVVSLFDRWDTWSAAQHQRSLTTISTFTFNLSLIADPSAHREDVGHLWYLSVEQQFYFAWVFILAWFGRIRWALMAGLAVGAITITWWRHHDFDQQGPWAAELGSVTRADGLLLGALGALSLPHVRRYGPVARRVALPCLGVMTGLVLVSAELDPYAFLKSQGVVFALASTLLVLAIAVGDHPGGLAERLLASRPIAMVGRVSFPLYLWHYPIFWASARWAAGIHWAPRATGSCLVLAAVVTVAHRFVDRPVAAWLEGVRLPPTRRRDELVT